MKLGIAIDWARPRLDIPLQRIQLAEELGFDSVWSAEAYGSDALTPLAFIAGHTRRIRLGTAIAQISARAPASLAMSMATLDQLAGDGRVICGLGLSGPQVVEGWYGQPWPRPYQRLADTVAILRKVWRREGPVTHDGEAIQLPLQDERALGYGKPLKSILHCNPDIPVFLGTGGGDTVRLTAEIADGWIPFGFVPGSLERYRPQLEEGFRRAGNGKSLADFEIQCGVQVDETDDIKAAIERQKPMTAMYVGGMGHEKMNFHKDLMVRRGYPEAAARIQELFLAGRRDEAIAAVPDEYIDDGALIGPPARIRERLNAWMDSGATGLTLYDIREETMRAVADHVGTPSSSCA